MNYLGEYLDLYQIHSATFESGVLDNSDVHKALYKCKTDHGIAIGLSVSSPQQNEIIQKALSVEVDGTKLFDSVQCTYNVFEQKPGPMLEQAYTEYGIDIIVKEGMANGRILQNPIIKQYAQQLQCTPDALALACVLAQKFHPSVLSGAVTPEQLQSNSEALSVMEHYFQQRNEDGSSDLLSEIMDQTRMDSNTYWTDRSQLTWN